MIFKVQGVGTVTPAADTPTQDIDEKDKAPEFTPLDTPVTTTPED